MAKEHMVPVYQAPEIRDATIQWCAKYHVDKAYAVQQMALKALRGEGFISQEVYDYYMMKYSRTLLAMSERPQELVKSLSLEQKKEQQKIEDMTRTFMAVLVEWDNTSVKRKPEWREMWVRQAEKYRDKIPEAKMLLEKIASKAGLS